MDALFENIQTTNLHTDAERADMRRELMENELATLRTTHMRRALRTLQTLRARRDGEAKMITMFEREQEARRAQQADPDAPPPFAMDIAHCEKTYDLYDRAAELWADELILFMQELRGELANRLEKEFGSVAIDLVCDLRKGSI